MRRLTGDEHRSMEFATTWPTLDLDIKTHALGYARLLTESSIVVDDEAIQVLRTAGWDERGIYEATALIAFFNFSRRVEAAAGLPPDEIPPHAPVLRTLPVAVAATAANSGTRATNTSKS